VPEPETQYIMGWSIIGVTVLNIAVNMLVMFYTSLRMLRLVYLRIKFKYLAWKLERQKKHPEETLTRGTE